MALKVVNLKETRIQEELLAEIEFLRELKTCRKVVDILEHELKSAKDVKGQRELLRGVHVIFLGPTQMKLNK